MRGTKWLLLLAASSVVTLLIPGLRDILLAGLVVWGACLGALLLYILVPSLGMTLICAGIASHLLRSGHVVGAVLVGLVGLACLTAPGSRCVGRPPVPSADT